MLSELQRIGLNGDSRVQFVHAVAPESPGAWPSRGAHGCYMSHLKILRDAGSANESVLILEDDCDFTEAALSSKWGEGFDIFYGGFGATDFSNPHASNIQGSHCMGFSRKIVPQVVDFLTELAATESPPPIDGAYVRFRQENPSVLTDFAIPQVAIQRQSASDIAPGRFDRSRLLSLAVSVLRRLNRGRHRRRKMLEGMTQGSAVERQ